MNETERKKLRTLRNKLEEVLEELNSMEDADQLSVITLEDTDDVYEVSRQIEEKLRYHKFGMLVTVVQAIKTRLD